MGDSDSTSDRESSESESLFMVSAAACTSGEEVATRGEDGADRGKDGEGGGE